MIKICQNSIEKIKTQGENSKSRHFQDHWMLEKRAKKPSLNAPFLQSVGHNGISNGVDLQQLSWVYC